MNEKCRKAALTCVGALPGKAILKLEKACLKRAPKYTELIREVRLRKYLERTDFERLDAARMPVGRIQAADWNYAVVNICCIDDMLRRIVLCLSEGYRPVLEVRDSVNDANLWEQFFVQPFGLPAPEEGKGVAYSDPAPPPLGFPAIPKGKDIALFGKLFRAFVIPNESTAAYFEEEYHRILEGKRVLGVLSRGTDYKARRPAGHPVQPELADLIALAGEKMKTLNCDAIYLATEESSVEEKFKAAFPGKILINKRRYLDDYYILYKNNPAAASSCAMVVEREGNARFQKSLEYLSSVMLLSKCCALVAGSCGGSRAAAYLNAGNYEYCHLFDLGLYP